LAVNGSTINENWFKDFFDGVNPLNNKEEIIFKYEIGFSRKIRENSIEARSIYRPSVIQRIYAQSSWLVRVIKIKALKGLGIVRAIQYLSEINRTHFLAADIAGQFGIIKKELILSNPHKISLSSINLSKIKTVNHKNNNNSNKENTANLFLKYKKCASADVNLTSIKIAVVIHLYYADLLEEILEEISVISDPFDIYFTTPFEGDIPKIFNLASKVAESVNVFVFPNRGRDIGPFFALYADGVFDKYICVLKLHTKKSKYSAKGDEWRRLLYNKVIGGPIGARRICSTFEMNKVGIIGPRDYYLTHKKFWGANFSMVKKILMEAKLLEDGFDPNLGFFAGSMFWFSPKAFVSLKNLQHSCLEFEIENGKQDGTLAHALERVFCLVSRGAGYSVNSIECDKLYNVDHIDTLSNRVPVL
jgi:rhamnosyltransferase